MSDGYLFICPEGSYMGADQYEKVFCALNGQSNWQIQHFDDFVASLPFTASGATASSVAEPSTGTETELVEALNLIFEFPPIDELAILMTAGFTTPMVAYIAARLFSELLSMLNDNYDNEN